MQRSQRVDPDAPSARNKCDLRVVERTAVFRIFGHFLLMPQMRRGGFGDTGHQKFPASNRAKRFSTMGRTSSAAEA